MLVQEKGEGEEERKKKQRLNDMSIKNTHRYIKNNNRTTPKYPQTLFQIELLHRPLYL